MPFVAAFILGLGLWLFAEIFAFGLVVDAIGLAGAVLATVLTSLAGAMLLRRLGRAARDELKAMVKDAPSLRLAPEALQTGVLAALGAVLLILPGFLSDCVGFALVLPSLRRQKRTRSNAETPEILDLSPQDWRRIDEPDHR